MNNPNNINRNNIDNAAVPLLNDVGEETFEVIVKFNGDLGVIADELNVEVEILSQGYAIITLTPDKIPTLYTYTQIESLELPKNIYFTSAYNLSSSCINSVQDPLQYDLRGTGVIIGLIDSGIDYTHPDFRNEDDSTRILYLWDQTIEGSPPEGFPAGTQYTREQINEALLSPDPFEVVPSMDTAGHGTAIAGIAAGNGRGNNGDNIGVAPEAELIVVKIGTRGILSFAKTTELMRAIKYVIDKARQTRKPVAINLSFGMNNGSHRGDSLLETFISDICMEWKVSIVIPTGNEGNAGHHYSGQIASSQTREIDFFTASGIEHFFISLWKNFVDSFSIELIFPGGLSSGIISIESQVKNIRINNLALTVLYGQPTHYSVRQEIYFDVKAESGTVTTGLWKLRLISADIVDGNFDIWLPSQEAVTDRTHFSSPTSTGTMTIPSTALRIITVAGYNDRIGNIAEFSGTGNPNMALPNPDIAAPAVGIMTTRAGGGYDSFTGTSMAAPFVTGSAALMMQWGIVNNKDPILYGERIKAFLRLGARRSGKSTYPNYSFGYGTLCLSNTISYMERYQWGGLNLWLQKS